MPGHDKSKIVGWIESDLDDFVCGICQGVLNKPVVTQCCRQSYCRVCIEEWLKGYETCPNDRRPLTIDGVSEAPRLFINFIGKMQIRCDYCDKGCPEVITIGSKVDHIKICRYNQCKTCGCDNMGNDHDCLAYLMKGNLQLTEMNDKLRKKKLIIESENNKLLSLISSTPSQQVTQPVTLISALVEAKDWPGTVVHNRNVCPEWRNGLIEVCNDAIRGFDLIRHDGLGFTKCIQSKITKKKFKILHWGVKAYCEDFEASNDNYSLKLQYTVRPLLIHYVCTRVLAR